ncbi:MAG TPA: reverse transcriptase domain-containing protein [Candidatus Saccharimonadales bacterium]|nr:reverse transcriptase domain-containing protein [Candidatus Saccharimonadales bacterium]
MSFSEKVQLEVYDLLETDSKSRNVYLKHALNVAATIERRKLISRRFPVKKASGGFRYITNATDLLRFLQYRVRELMVEKLPKTMDMNETGKGVSGAVSPHKNAKFALAIDIKGAYDHVVSWRIKKAFRLYLRNDNISDEALDFLCYLITYPINGVDVACQGFVSSQTAFNLQMYGADQLLKVALWHLGLHKITYVRYADNLIWSSKHRFDHKQLFKSAQAILGGAGFTVGSSEYYDRYPIRYLGTEIYQDRVSIDEEKEGEHIDRILQYLESDRPHLYRDSVTGIYNWSHLICGEKIPPALLKVLWIYYMKVGNPPKSLQEIMEHKLNYKLL